MTQAERLRELRHRPSAILRIGERRRHHYLIGL